MTETEKTARLLRDMRRDYKDMLESGISPDSETAKQALRKIATVSFKLYSLKYQQARQNQPTFERRQ